MKKKSSKSYILNLPKTYNFFYQKPTKVFDIYKGGVRFRKWSISRIKQCIIKGYVMADEHLKNLGGGKYFCELLNRTKNIRSIEKKYLNSINKINKIAEKLSKD